MTKTMVLTTEIIRKIDIECTGYSNRLKDELLRVALRCIINGKGEQDIIEAWDSMGFKCFYNLDNSKKLSNIK